MGSHREAGRPLSVSPAVVDRSVATRSRIVRRWTSAVAGSKAVSRSRTAAPNALTWAEAMVIARSVVKAYWGGTLSAAAVLAAAVRTLFSKVSGWGATMSVWTRSPTWRLTFRD